MNSIEKKIELNEFITFIKDEVKKSETKKPKEGFWIGANTLEMTVQTTTESNTEVGLKIYVLSGGSKKTEKSVQTVKIGFVTQEYKP